MVSKKITVEKLYIRSLADILGIVQKAANGDLGTINYFESQGLQYNVVMANIINQMKELGKE